VQGLVAVACWVCMLLGLGIRRSNASRGGPLVAGAGLVAAVLGSILFGQPGIALGSIGGVLTLEAFRRDQLGRGARNYVLLVLGVAGLLVGVDLLAV
jgi:hypothetical protein